MKRNDNFLLKELAGQHILIPIGDYAVDFHGVITLNPTGKLIWENMEKDTSVSELVQLLVKEYNIEEDVALNDVNSFVENLKEAGCLDD